MTSASLTSASRFYQRWLAADAGRAAAIDTLVQSPLCQLDLAAALARESASKRSGRRRSCSDGKTGPPRTQGLGRVITFRNNSHAKVALGKCAMG